MRERFQIKNKFKFIMDWPRILLSIILSALFSGIGIAYLFQISGTYNQLSENPDSTCEDSVFVFLELLKFFCKALILYTLPVLIVINAEPTGSPRMIRIFNIIFVLHSILISFLWVFLMLMSGVILYYSRAICDEASTVLWSYAVTSASITGVVLILMGFSAAAFGSRQRAVQQDEENSFENHIVL